MSGLMSITGFPDGPPTRVGESLGDICAGLYAAWSTCAALYAREQTGRGTQLDVSMFESLLSLQVTAHSQYQVTGEPPGRVGNRHPVSTPFDTYRAADGLVVVAVASDALFGRLATLLAWPELADDPRFATDELRTRHEPALREIIEAWTGARTVDEVVAAASDAGVPASPIWNLQEALDSAQARHRQLVSSFEHPAAGRIDVVEQPVRFEPGERLPPAASPALGEHTDEVLRDLLGLEPGQLAALRSSGAI
jgi:CoA:oxalate CoA-transferase